MSSRPQHLQRRSLTLPLLFLIPLAAACADRTPTAVAPNTVAFNRTSAAGTRWVSPAGTDTGDCTAAPCRTIGYAVGQADNGDVISVAAGTYQEAVSVTKRLELVGHDAVIDATGQESPPNGIVISGPGAAGTQVSGFTVENANLEGIFAVQTSGIRIENNVVMNNDAYGPYDPHCAANPDDCGEAIHLQSVTNSTVKGNYVHDNIGGILLTDENGPTSHNMISDNTVMNNTLDCGITLASHWFDPTKAATPDVAGVYQNTILHNTSNGNGAAGIGVFAGPPGAAAWGNIVTGNTAMNNGFAGLMIHSHTPAQYVDGNVLSNNTLSGNNIDDDNTADDAPAGISVFSAVIPIPHTVISANHISDEHYGVITLNALNLSGLNSNKFDASVAVPISIH
jgi:parallel beta-helix repeat protein